jgi:DNA processing protein
MAREELAAWLRLLLTPGVGNETARKLLAAFGLPQTVFLQSLTALQTVVGARIAEALQEIPDELEPALERLLTWLAESGRHHLLTLGDARFPSALLQIADPPVLLYVLGDLEALSHPNKLAIVGSRNPTHQGATNAHQFAQALGQAGLCIVSGLALGVDGAAHEGALAAGARTIAVVGTGLDRVYPKAHHGLAHRIAQHGLLLSEYPLGTPPLNANFPKRNRLIAGLARGTLVVEAALQSGSLITARLTSEQGKDVFAIPGSIHAAQSRGCHALIKQGAKLVESAQDILEELQGFSAGSVTTALSVSQPDTPGDENSVDGPALLLTALGFDPVGLDALQGRTRLTTADLQARLMTLELDGQVARLPGGLFQRLPGN